VVAIPGPNRSAASFVADVTPRTLAGAAAPAAFRVISPIFGQLVTFSMPANFVVVAENSNGPSYIREAVLKGETINRWTQIITVTGAQGLVSGPKANPKATPETFAGSIVGGFRSACPDSFAAQGFGPTKFGDQGAHVAVASCGSVGTDRHGETALIVAVKGQADYYTLQWAERRKPPENPSSTRQNGCTGCASCSRSASARSSSPARRRPTRVAPSEASHPVDNPHAPGPASKQAAMVCYRHTGLNNDGQNTCGSPWSVPAISA
jgi:hypothetical protein